MKRKTDKLLQAAETMDWQQVVLHGGPPCFHRNPADAKFCGRAQWWEGHKAPGFHEFVSLRDLIESVKSPESEK